MRLATTLFAAALLGAVPVVMIQSASAAPLQADQTLGQIGTNVETVQYRHHGGRHHGGSRYYGHRHGRYGGGYYRNGAAVIGGLAAGAIIGGAIANSQARAADAVGYCSQRYNSYDPASGTYLGYDGQRHACP